MNQSLRSTEPCTADGVATAADLSEVRWARRLYAFFAPWYDAFRAVWSAWTRAAEKELDQLFAERIGPRTRILELAPGTGVNLVRLFRCARQFCSYAGVDVSEKMLKRAQKKACGDPRIAFRVGDATNLSEIHGRFDFIVSTWFLSHLPSPQETMAATVELLAPGGTAAFLFFSAPDHLALRWPLALAGRVLFRARFVEVEPIRRRPWLERMSRHAGGMATLAVFRCPEAGSSS